MIKFAMTFLTLSFCAAACGQTTRPSPRDIFVKRLSADQVIAVTSEPCDIASLAPIARTLVDLKGKAEIIRVEARQLGHTPVELAAQVSPEIPDDVAGNGFEVLDVVWRDGEVVVVCLVGCSVGLWRISAQRVGYSNGWTLIQPGGGGAMIQRLKRDFIDVRMTPLPNYRWKVVVTDKRSGGHVETYGQQGADVWNFEPITATEKRSGRGDASDAQR